MRNFLTLIDSSNFKASLAIFEKLMTHSSACLDENGSKFITQSSDQHGYLFYGQRGSSVSDTNYQSGHLTPGVNLATQWLQKKKKIRARLFFGIGYLVRIFAAVGSGVSVFESSELKNDFCSRWKYFQWNSHSWKRLIGFGPKGL